MSKKTKRNKQKGNSQVSKAQTPADALTPVVMVGATWVATKLAEVVFKGVTGKQPPSANDDAEELWKIAFWTGVMTAAITMTEVGVRRLLQGSTKK